MMKRYNLDFGAILPYKNLMLRKIIISLFFLILLTPFYLFLATNVKAEPILSSEYSDEFNSTTLDPKWSWVREDPTHWSLTDNLGYMHITTRNGWWMGNQTNISNILLESVPSEPFEISTKLDFSPTEYYQSAGLILYQDDNNIITLVRFQDRLIYSHLTDGAGGEDYNIPLNWSTTYLRLREDGEGNKIASYSADGVNWIFLGGRTTLQTSTRMGIYGTSGYQGAPEISANFDYFHVIVGADHSYTPSTQYFNDEFNSLIVDPRWEIRNEDGVLWTLNQNPGSMRIYTELGTLPANPVQRPRNIFLQTPPTGDFAIESKVTFSPTQTPQTAGIIIMDDLGTYVSVYELQTTDSPNDVWMMSGHQYQNMYFGQEGVPGPFPSTFYLKMEKRGSFFHSYWSSDRINWISIRDWQLEMSNNLKVGFYAANNHYLLNEIPADFDFFHVYPIYNLTSLDPAKVWVGLRNSYDFGIRFDLMAEVYKNSEIIGSGQLDSVWGGGSGFYNARLNSIPLTLIAPTTLQNGDQLSLKVYVRNACIGSWRNSGTARLWYNDSAADSHLGVEINSVLNNYYLLNNYLLGTEVGSGPKITRDVSAGYRCSPFKLFGTWNTTF